MSGIFATTPEAFLRDMQEIAFLKSQVKEAMQLLQELEDMFNFEEKLEADSALYWRLYAFRKVVEKINGR